MEGTMKDGRKRLPAAAMVRRMCTVFAAAGLMAACPASAQPASRMPIAGLAKSWVLVAPSRVHPWDGNGGIITATSPNDDPFVAIGRLWDGICDAIHDVRMQNHRPTLPKPKPKPRYKLKLLFCILGAWVLMECKHWIAKKLKRKKG